MNATTDPPLYWALRRRAAALNIHTVPQLAALTGANRQSLYLHWAERSASISLEMLERLGKSLGRGDQPAHMGDWFCWDEHGTLRWNIRHLAQQRLGITSLPELYWKVSRPPQQVALYWSGEARFVFVRTLAALARPFLAVGPFDTGDFFSWEPPKRSAPEGVVMSERTSSVPILA